MANVNLLPEEFRQREQKELKKIASHPKVTKIGLSEPFQVSTPLIDTDRHQSWWQRLFGINESVKSQALPTSTGPKPAVQSVDVLGPAKSQRIDYDRSLVDTKVAVAKLPVKSSHGRGKWSWPVGRHTTLTLSVSDPNPTAHADWGRTSVGDGAGMKAHAQSVVSQSTPARTDDRPARPDLTVTMPAPDPIATIGWWEIISSLFMPRRHQRPAHLAVDRPMRTVAPAPVRPMPTPAPVKSTPPPVTKKPIPTAKKSSLSAGDDVSDGGFNINFLPEELMSHTYFGPTAYLIGLIVAVVLPIALTGVLYFVMDRELATTQELIKSKESATAKVEKVLIDYRSASKLDGQWYSRLVAIDNILGGHVYWSRFFTQLEKYTLDGVQFGAFSADTSGALVLPATATDYDTAVRQIVALRQATDFVAKVEVNALNLAIDKTKGASGVSFSLKIILVEDIFNKKL